ncbi:uncharacterized protein MYCGRDRAFT_77127 [Zymoseptoria tritici IPO323]|uniref:chitinase n=1 Tax=Zymoseptoria tritici (strain CBS 115943 / IPO323) TaxID=336722 RepID=F9XMB0_ZYMTI|nr:uncharacterized protein MYCGRDRAFT_77127 [Zymoseptoria tritici IPO323]EGP83476.1 hypothetical protein MYCGRDRAFT_77127 [Zymoseptoria tritici IPO323]
MSLARTLLSALLLATTTTFAQTHTECSPLNSTCPPNPALGTELLEVFNSSSTELNSKYWHFDGGQELVSFGKDGVHLSLKEKGDTVTIKSNFYIFFGTLEFIMKAAPGNGIISTVILLSDDLDEIDWEIKGGNTTAVSNNYYGWGNQDQRFAEDPALDGPQNDYHNYTIDWTQERIEYLIDSNVVRTVHYDEPGLYPQTPSRVQFGVWCGGCSNQPGTVEWAGGAPDFSKGPFTASIASLRVTDAHTNASTYTWSDRTGSYQSIAVTAGKSEAYKAIHHESTRAKLSSTWAGMSPGAKIGVAAGILGAVAVAAVAFAAYCVRERKAGRAERAMHEMQWEKQEEENLEYRRMMSGGEGVESQRVLMEGKWNGSGYGRL